MRYIILFIIFVFNFGCVSKPLLDDVVQLTLGTEFEKAGEAYFSSDGTKVIFQAIPLHKGDDVLDKHYSMYVADIYKLDGKIKGIENIIRVSPPLSANTCGWFYPNSNNRIIYGTTGGPMGISNVPGYQRDKRDYRWDFPPEMNIVEAVINDDQVEILSTLVKNNEAYIAEGSISPDGRYLLYTTLETGDGDIYVKDLKNGSIIKLVTDPGYDGGPFFDTTASRICYRSDRLNNDLLQVYVKDLVHNSEGLIVGATNEIALTNNKHVNWGPYWHPSGKTILYATSEIGHNNYEIFAVDTGKDVSKRKFKRITFYEGFDGLPTMDLDGKWMLWTKHDENRNSQIFVGRLSDLFSDLAQ